MTTRRLVLIRHAKAATGQIDVDRPLADRGIDDATAIGHRLALLGLEPDRVVVSPSLRTRQTWETAAAVQGRSAAMVVDQRVYDNSIEDLLAAIRDTPDSVQTLALVGHNPSIGELAGVLDDGAGVAAAREAIARSYPTSGICVFDVAAQWSDVGRGDGTIASFTVPRG